MKNIPHLALVLCLLGGSLTTMAAQQTMKQDEMKQDSMKHDDMKHDGMKQDGMKHDDMKQDEMKDKMDGNTGKKMKKAKKGKSMSDKKAAMDQDSMKKQ